MPPAAMAAAADQQRIDELLRRYLGLVDEYTRLRGELARLLAGVHHSLARAHFAAERGARFGQGQYDGRMRAARVLHIAGGTVPVFAVGEREDEEKGEEEKGEEENGEEEKNNEGQAAETEAAKEPAGKRPPPADPLRWFGLLAPLPLRDAQGLSVEAVARVVPRLASVDAAMRHVEIEMRRARKRRAKALLRAAEGRKGDDAVEVA